MSKSDIQDALESFEKCKSAWSEIYEKSRDDQIFYSGEQWDERDRNARIQAGRSTLTTSYLQQFVHQVTNDIRQNTPQIKVLPVDDKGDVKTAKILQGLIKNIENISKADTAYDIAAENAVISSIGFIRIDRDYVFPDRFEQHILIKPVVNPLSVWIDHNSILPDGSDAKFAYIMDKMTIDDFKSKFPDAEISSFGDRTFNKDKENTVTIAEYFCIKKKKKKILLLNNGDIIDEQDIQNIDPSLGIKPVSSRIIESNMVMHQRLSGNEILEQTIFPGGYIPIVPVYGEERYVDGRRQIWSLIRNAKDAQRKINYYASLEIESLSKAPQAPFMAYEGQLEGYEKDWQNPHSSMVLQHVPTYDKNGNLLAQPQRLAPPMIPAGVINAKQGSIEEMKASMGLYDTNLGKQDNAVSGLAIGRRQQQGRLSTSHFGDNLAKSVGHVGNIILSMIPEIYDTPRVVQIISPDDQPQMVAINSGGIYDINAGKYHVKVTTGPSYDTRREETQQLMANIMQTNPALVQVMGDLFFKYSDTPGADVIAERLRKTIPPQLLEGENGETKQDPEKMQMRQAIQQMQQELQAAKMELQSKNADQQIKVAELQIKAKELEIKEMEAKSKLSSNDNFDKQIEMAKLELEKYKIQKQLALEEKKLNLDIVLALNEQEEKEKDKEESKIVEQAEQGLMQN